MIKLQPRGFIALVSAIIISAILLLVVVGGSLEGIYSRMNVLDFESKERSAALADACVDALILRIANGQTIPGTVAVGSDSCQILTATTPYSIQATFNNAYTHLNVGVDSGTLAITSWVEVP